MKIGSLKLKNPYFLAPMADINDIAFRTLCKKAGAGLVYTGMINPLTRKAIELSDNPALQLFSIGGEGIAEFIKKYEKNVSLFDFNLGCSAYVAKRSGFGAFMHHKTDIIEKILETMRSSTKKPVTIKLRKSNRAAKIVRLAEKYCDAICIHPRTKVQGYSGKADLAFAERVKRITSLPVIYSGDVNEKNADEFLKKFDFVMIGREAMGNPNVFAKLTGKEPVFGFKEYLKLALKYKFRFIKIRAQAIYFTKYHEHATRLRRDLSTTQNLRELKKVFD